MCYVQLMKDLVSQTYCFDEIVDELHWVKLHYLDIS